MTASLAACLHSTRGAKRRGGTVYRSGRFLSLKVGSDTLKEARPLRTISEIGDGFPRQGVLRPKGGLSVGDLETEDRGDRQNLSD
jgi:hypothetical protein